MAHSAPARRRLGGVYVAADVPKYDDSSRFDVNWSIKGNHSPDTGSGKRETKTRSRFSLAVPSGERVEGT